jgi:hypothetical protein
MPLGTIQCYLIFVAFSPTGFENGVRYQGLPIMCKVPDMLSC